MSFYSSVIHTFLISFGVVIGASIFTGLGAIITNHPPYKSMIEVASSIKIWAIAGSLGGTFSSLTVIEKGYLKVKLNLL